MYSIDFYLHHPHHVDIMLYSFSHKTSFLFPQLSILTGDYRYHCLLSPITSSSSIIPNFIPNFMINFMIRYQELADHVTHKLQEASRTYLYLPRHRVSLMKKPQGDFSIGGEADSYFEMLIKQWIQTGKVRFGY